MLTKMIINNESIKNIAEFLIKAGAKDE